jgi:hypothetical protein
MLPAPLPWTKAVGRPLPDCRNLQGSPSIRCGRLPATPPPRAGRQRTPPPDLASEIKRRRWSGRTRARWGPHLQPHRQHPGIRHH